MLLMSLQNQTTSYVTVLLFENTGEVRILRDVCVSKRVLKYQGGCSESLGDAYLSASYEDVVKSK